MTSKSPSPQPKPKLGELSPEQKRVAIATACGWTTEILGNLPQDKVWKMPSGQRCPCGPPDYLNDLNACHEAEKTLTSEQRTEYFCVALPSITGAKTDDWMHKQLPLLAGSTAAQRADAFLLALNLATL